MEPISNIQILNEQQLENTDKNQSIFLVYNKIYFQKDAFSSLVPSGLDQFKDSPYLTVKFQAGSAEPMTHLSVIIQCLTWSYTKNVPRDSP